MTESRTCPSCGLTVSDGAAYCPHCGTPQLGASPASEDPAARERLEAALRSALDPQYQLVRRIGRGGMGSVYLARDPVLKRSVAVKVLAPELAADETARTRFQREAQAVAALSHPNVVAIHSVGVLETGAPYFVMQHVEGGNLEERLVEEGPLEVAEAKRVLGQVASALEAAHAKGIIHRDVKPSNVLHDPESDRVLVSDFGIAAVQPGAQVSGPTHLTQTGTTVGTPRYMSPEQLLGEAVTEKTDIYGLGLLAYELLTGQSPFEGKSPQMVAAAHLKDAPPDLGEAREDVDPELREVVRACLSKEAAERPAASELVRRLQPATGGLLEWPPPGLEGLVGAYRRPAAALLAGGVVGLLPALFAMGPGGDAPAWAVGTGVVGVGFAIVGLILVGLGVLLLARVVRGVGAAFEAGHTWATTVEVLADVRGDTGAVIAGTREYAGLPTDRRVRIRRARLARAAAVCLAALLPLPTFLWVVRLAGTGTLGPAWAWTLPVLPAAMLVTLAGVLRLLEHARVGETRKAARRRRNADRILRRVIGAWYERLQELTGTGARSRDRPGVRNWAVRLTAVVLALGMVGAAVLLIFLMGMTTAGGHYVETLQPDFRANTLRVFREAEAARAYRIPRDSTLTPLEAGVLLARMAPPRRGRGLRPVPDTFPATWIPSRCDTAFGGPFRAALSDIFDRAARGLTRAQLACLSDVADHPGLGALARTARSPGLDLEGAYMTLPYPPDMLFYEIPIPPMRRFDEAAVGAIGAAALAVAEERPDDAERLMRELLSTGLLMLDESHYLLMAMTGSRLAAQGLNALEEIYRVSGRAAEARRLGEVKDSVGEAREMARITPGYGVRGRTTNVEDLRREILSAPLDENMIRSARWDALTGMAFLSCANLRELVFGPGVDVLAMWDQAESELVRYPSEAELFRVVKETLPRLAHEQKLMQLGYRPAVPNVPDLYLALGRMLANPRIQGCAITAW